MSDPGLAKVWPCEASRVWPTDFASAFYRMGTIWCAHILGIPRLCSAFSRLRRFVKCVEHTYIYISAAHQAVVTHTNTISLFLSPADCMYMCIGCKGECVHECVDWWVTG